MPNQGTVSLTTSPHALHRPCVAHWPHHSAIHWLFMVSKLSCHPHILHDTHRVVPSTVRAWYPPSRTVHSSSLVLTKSYYPQFQPDTDRVVLSTVPAWYPPSRTIHRSCPEPTDSYHPYFQSHLGHKRKASGLPYMALKTDQTPFKTLKS